MIDDIAATLGIRRSDLNVVATSKGLFRGALRLVSQDGSALDGTGKASASRITADQELRLTSTRVGRTHPAEPDDRLDRAGPSPLDSHRRKGCEPVPYSRFRDTEC